jgi:hypothetical protein
MEKENICHLLDLYSEKCLNDPVKSMSKLANNPNFPTVSKLVTFKNKYCKNDLKECMNIYKDRSSIF